MRINLRTLLAVYTTLFLGLNLVQCSSLGKIAPEYRGVDPRAEHFVKEFKELAEIQGITFKHEVTVGFKKLEKDTVGLTTYGFADSFREVDLDPVFWEHSTEITRQTLLFHELIHSYCGRGHTYENDKDYPEYETWHGRQPQEGRYRDGTNCPESLMYPMVLDDFCVLIHYTDYVTEMFNYCREF